MELHLQFYIFVVLVFHEKQIYNIIIKIYTILIEGGLKPSQILIIVEWFRLDLAQIANLYYYSIRITLQILSPSISYAS